MLTIGSLWGRDGLWEYGSVVPFAPFLSTSEIVPKKSIKKTEEKKKKKA